MPPNKVTPSNIYSVWQKMNSLRGKIPHGRVKFKMEDLVRITKENVKFAMGMKKIFSTEIFQVVKSIQRMPQPVCELSDLQALFYRRNVLHLRAWQSLYPQTEFQIGNIVRPSNKYCIKQHLFKWKE
jgi:hypothetical protein